MAPPWRLGVGVTTDQNLMAPNASSFHGIGNGSSVAYSSDPLKYSMRKGVVGRWQLGQHDAPIEHEKITPSSS